MARRRIASISLGLSFFIATGLTTAANAETGQACVSENSDSHATCLAMIEAVRQLLHGDGTRDPACAASGPDDMATTNAVIDWIRSHPDRQDEDLAALVREALVTVDSCAQRPLIPTAPETDPLDVD
jgi:hypothetical protein